LDGDNVRPDVRRLLDAWLVAGRSLNLLAAVQS
jgi:hypothetical protein